jgi:hypothetical protein
VLKGFGKIRIKCDVLDSSLVQKVGLVWLGLPLWSSSLEPTSALSRHHSEMSAERAQGFVPVFLP